MPTPDSGGRPATAEGAEPVVGVVSGPPPLRLPRVVADVVCLCDRCGGSDHRTVVVAADWWDREAVLLQRRQVAGLPCTQCGAPVEPPVPLLQLRRMDGADLLVGLPRSTSFDIDNVWLAAAVTLLRPVLPDSPRIVSMRADWWPHLDNVPLGPVLTGLVDLPASLPDEPSARRLWLRETREVVGAPAVHEAVGHYLTAPDTDTESVIAAEPCLIDPAWRTSVVAAGARFADGQETEAQRKFVAERLDQLSRRATDGLTEAGEAEWVPDVQAALDRAVAVDLRDPRRLTALQDVVALLEPRGPSTTLSRAMTSLVASSLAAPERTPADSEALERLAEVSADLAEELFGRDHRITVSNRINLLLARQERPGLDETGVTTLVAEYEAMTTDPAVHRSGWVVDVLINLATMTEHRQDLGRGDRQELMLAILEDAAHIAALSKPDDVRTRVFCLTNQAAVLRQRVAGAQRANAGQALARLDEAHRLEMHHRVLLGVERMQLAVNRLNALATCHVLGVRDTAAQEVILAAREVAASADLLGEHNDMAVRALGGAGSVLVELYGIGVRSDSPDAALWRAAEPLLVEADRRADATYPVGTTVRLTTRLNLAALYGMAVDGSVADAEKCGRLLEEVAFEAAGRSAEHEATAWSNLAGLRLGQGRWDDAADCFGRARAARRAMVEQSAARHTRLGEVIATGDLAVREALVHTHQARLDVAVQTLEDGRVALLRHRRAVPAGLPPALDEPDRAVVYLAICDLATFGIVRSRGQADRGFVSASSAAPLRAALRDLATAPTRVQRMLAVRRVERLLGDLVGVVGTLVGDDTTDLCVVACGPLSGAPLHAVPDSTGRCWLDRWTVRYWPSAQVAATLRQPRRFESLTAVAVPGTEEDLPLASSELTAVAGLVARVEVPPATWRVDAWLRRALRGAGLAHFACHARSDLVDPTGSSFEFGIGGRLTVADLLDWDDVDDLDMVVASACQAGVPSSDAPDEYLGIGFGLLHTGAQSVISPLWEVNDTPTALLMARLYRELTAGHEPAHALRLAQTWTRDVDNATLSALAGPDAPEEAGWLPAGVAARIVAETKEADPAVRPFRHPVDWAAFAYLGA